MIRSPVRRGPSTHSPGVVVLAVACLVLSGCDGGLFVEPAAAPGQVEMQLALSTSSTGAQPGLDVAYGAVDRALVTLQFEGGDGMSEVVEVDRVDGELRLAVPLELDEAEVSASLAVELRAGDDPLYRGSTDLVLERGVSVTVELTPEPVPAAIVLPPEPAPLEAIGDSLLLPGAVVFATGDTIPGWDPDWSSLNPDIVSVEDAFAVATGEGAATLRASFRTLQSSWTVRVQPVVESIAVIPPAVELAPGGTTTLSADMRDRRGNLIQTVPVDWSSEDSTVATVDGEGVVEGVSPGSTRVFARAGGLEAASDVTVSVLPPTVETLEPVEVGEDRATLRARVEPGGASTTVVFELATDPGFQSFLTTQSTPVDADQDEVVVSYTVEDLEPDAGYYVRARATNQAGSAVGESVSFDTEPAAVATVTVLPAELQIGPGQSTQLELELRDARGELLSDRPADWSSAAPEIAEIDGDGVVTGVASGTTEITATVEGIEGQSVVEVVLLPPLAETLDASQVFERQARLHASVTPRTATTQVRFRWGTHPALANANLTSAVTLDPSSEEQLVPHTLFTLNDNTTYYFRVEAENAGGAVVGEILEFRTQLEIEAPTNLTAVPDGPIFVNWDYPSELIGQVTFELERGIVEGTLPPPSWSLLATPSLPTYDDQDLQNGVTYAYRVRACDENERCSNYSNVDSATAFVGDFQLREPRPPALVGESPQSLDVACRPERPGLFCTRVLPHPDFD